MPSVNIPNTFTPSTVISSSQVNANFTAMANGIGASLALDGSDVMTGPVKASNGTAGAPSLTFAADLDTGIYRRGANELAFATAGVLAAYLDADGKLWLEDALDLAGDADVGGNLIVAGNGTVGGTLAVTGVATLSSTLNLGHASDTTLSRASAGVLAVEGVNLLRANQDLSDVSSASTAFGNIKQAASDTASGVLEIAVKGEMETPASTTLAVVPARQMQHPTHPKCSGIFNGTGTPAFLQNNGFGGITDHASGDYTLAISTAFTDGNYTPLGSVSVPGSAQGYVAAQNSGRTKTATALPLEVLSFSTSLTDRDNVSVLINGFHA